MPTDAEKLLKLAERLLDRCPAHRGGKRFYECRCNDAKAAYAIRALVKGAVSPTPPHEVLAEAAKGLPDE